MIRNFTRDAHDLTTDWGHASRCACSTTCARASSSIRRKRATCYNLEATPAEGTTYRFAKEDRRRYPDILQAGTPQMPYYTNSSQLAGGLHRRSVRGARTPGRPAAQIHGRHGAASVHDRAAVVRRRVPHAR
ncbi:anaerobic ribonucleoside-triphosphate reductase [Burkholderia mallei]|uniref:anaerobic ribonucleoside-triphosphate reductase n=1 Tax=Burkholderia mallei TaxID=13373 RepID=UPI003BEF3B49